MFPCKCSCTCSHRVKGACGKNTTLRCPIECLKFEKVKLLNSSMLFHYYPHNSHSVTPSRGLGPGTKWGHVGTKYYDLVQDWGTFGKWQTSNFLCSSWASQKYWRNMWHFYRNVNNLVNNDVNLPHRVYRWWVECIMSYLTEENNILLWAGYSWEKSVTLLGKSFLYSSHYPCSCSSKKRSKSKWAEGCGQEWD